MRKAPLLCLLLLLALQASPAWSAPRAPILADTWYPGDARELASMVNTMLEAANIASTNDTPKPMALISPHAGYIYSGQVAAHGYALVRGRNYRTVVVIAPSHRASFSGVSVHDVGGYKTPLGTMSLDQEFIHALRGAVPFIRHVPSAHEQEHSLEIQIPFLQMALPDARLVPLVMGSQDPSTVRELAQALASVTLELGIPGRVLLVASTDLSHFHSRKRAARLDQRFADCVARLDPSCLRDCLSSGECEACGGGPAMAVMEASRELGANEALVLSQADSSDAGGPPDRVVGYLSAAFFVAGMGGADQSSQSASRGDLSAKEREILLSIAHDSIAAGVTGKDYLPPEEIPEPLRQARGAFVTLKRHGKLRGCIGNLVGRDPLHLTVSRMARAAALEDPRFPPLSQEELRDIEIEISVLTSLRRISSLKDVEVGTHGLLMRRGSRQGTLLPQVPVELGWGRREFLKNTCLKSGMEPDCWKDPATEIYTYSAEVFP